MRAPAAVVVAASLAACAAGTTGAPQAPTYAPADETTAGAAKSSTRPLILEWPAADRAALEAQRAQGVVVVRYAGRDIEVLGGCRVAAAYRYVPVTPKTEDVVMRDRSELDAAMPVHGVNLEAKLAQKQQLDVALMVVGTYEADARAWAAADLQGQCDGATHVVQELTVGAFEIDASAQASQAAGAGAFGIGASASHDASREVLHRDGDAAACAKSAARDATPPFGCGAMLRMQVVPIRFPAAAASAGGCGPGLVRKGDACVAVSGDRPQLLDVLQSH
ncbi:MAG TPA: hypothetical protein VF765_34955 [Polyangiaceae bacterium]